MAIQAQFGGLLLPPYATEEQQMRALKDYAGALLTPGAADGGYAYACGAAQYDDYYCATHSELTCNGAAVPVPVPVPMPSRNKRGREEDDDDHLLRHYYDAPLLPPVVVPASTSGRAPEAPPAPAAADHVWFYGAAEVDAECDRLRADWLALEVARWERQRRALVRAAAAALEVSSSGLLAKRAREAEAELVAARRRAAELEERVVLAAAEAQAWCAVARGNEAVALGLQATLDALLLRSAEGFGESSSSGEPEDAQSCCCVVGDGGMAAGDDDDSAPASANAAKWACRKCGDGEASVLVLPCRHLCLCKACEPRTDACPVCSGDKNAALHIATN